MWYSFSRDMEKGILNIVVSDSSLKEIKIFYGSEKTHVKLTKNVLLVNVECFFKKVEVHTDDDKQDVNISVEYENNSNCDFSIAINPNESGKVSTSEKVCQESAFAKLSEEPTVVEVYEEPIVTKDTSSIAAILRTDIRTDSPPERPLHHPKTCSKTGSKTGSNTGSKTSCVDNTLTYDQIVNLIYEAISNANELIGNELMEDGNVRLNINILDFITTKLNGRVLKFNPLNLTNSVDTIEHWSKSSKKPPIFNSKINESMIKDMNILVVYDRINKKLIRSVLYGYDLKEKGNSSLIF